MRNNSRNIFNNINLNIAAVVAVGLLSFLLLIYSNTLWRNMVRRSIPLLDNLMQARVAASEGHIWLEELINGNPAISMDTVRESYRQAADAMDACLGGKSAISGVPGLHLADSQLTDQFNRMKWSIQQAEQIAENRWQKRADTTAEQVLARQHQAAYHGGGLLAGAINMNLQAHIGEKMKTQNKVFHLTLILWGGILACVCAILMFYNLRQKKAEAALIDSENRLHILSSHLLAAQEQERRRISLELHDEMGQSLTVLKLQVRAVEKRLMKSQKELRTDCLNILSGVDQIIDNVRRLSRDLSPAILEDLGLTAALQWLAENVEKHAGISILVDLPDLDDLFDRESAIVIYRICQEALNNMAKHSQAAHASIKIDTSSNSVRFIIEDNGKGFDLNHTPVANSAEKGLGLTAMHERARMLGGTLEIQSGKGKGTRISFTVPFREDRTDEKI